MNLTPGQAHEAYVGPPSEPVQVSEFLESVDRLQEEQSVLHDGLRDSWNSLSQDEKERIEAECRVDDIRAVLEETVENPRLMGHVVKYHEATVHAIYETAEPTRKKRKRTVIEPANELPEVTALQLQHEAIKLKCWPLTINAAPFIRPPRQADHNTLFNVKPASKSSVPEGHVYDALMFVVVYNRVSWGQKILSRSSQHVLLSSQSLGDLFEAIPCTSHELPKDIGTDTNSSVRRDQCTVNTDMDTVHGAVVCLEGVLYGDGQSEDDYAEKVYRSLPDNQQCRLTKGAPMHDAKLSELRIRLHEPYWLLHAGNCEHFFAFHMIRLRHPSDPQSGYPLTTQITPPLTSVCRVCTKVPAVYSIVGDIRLGESPFLICAPCWRWMGNPRDESEVLVVPLPDYELGWATNT